MILGLGLDHVRKIPVDSDFRMRQDVLEGAIEEDRRAGKNPFCVVAAAGTVNTGAIDSIDSIAGLCARENLWLHVDGAYGALFVLSDEWKDRLSPRRRADSISLGPHKLLFAPLEAGCLIVRDREKLRKTFHFPSPYLTVEDEPLLMSGVLSGTPGAGAADSDLFPLQKRRRQPGCLEQAGCGRNRASGSGSHRRPRRHSGLHNQLSNERN